MNERERLIDTAKGALRGTTLVFFTATEDDDESLTEAAAAVVDALGIEQVGQVVAIGGGQVSVLVDRSLDYYPRFDTTLYGVRALAVGVPEETPR